MWSTDWRIRKASQKLCNVPVCKGTPSCDIIFVTIRYARDDTTFTLYEMVRGSRDVPLQETCKASYQYTHRVVRCSPSDRYGGSRVYVSEGKPIWRKFVPLTTEALSIVSIAGIQRNICHQFYIETAHPDTKYRATSYTCPAQSRPQLREDSNAHSSWRPKIYDHESGQQSLGKLGCHRGIIENFRTQCRRNRA